MSVTLILARKSISSILNSDILAVSMDLSIELGLGVGPSDYRLLLFLFVSRNEDEN